MKKFNHLFSITSFTLFMILLAAGPGTAGPGPENASTRKGPASGCDIDEELCLYSAKEGTYHPENHAFAIVAPVSQSLLSAPVSMQVVRVFLEQGDTVQKEDTLAAIRSPGLSKLVTQWKQASRQAELAKKSLELVRVKRKSNLATKADVIDAQARLSAEQEELSSIEERLEEALMILGCAGKSRRISQKAFPHVFKVCSPMSGTISKRFVSAGETVKAGAPLFSIQDTSSVIIKAGVECQKADSWLNGEAFLEKDNNSPLIPLSKRPLFDEQTGLCKVLFQAENPDGKLFPGQVVSVKSLGKARPCVYVPVEAVVSRNGMDFCITKEPSGLKPVRVITGRPSGGSIAILKGILPGNLVVTRGAYEILYRDINRLMKFED